MKNISSFVKGASITSLLIISMVALTLGGFLFLPHEAGADTTASLVPTGNGIYSQWRGTSGSASALFTEIDEIPGPSTLCTSGGGDYMRSDVGGTSLGAGIRSSFIIDLSSVPNGSTITSLEVIFADKGDSASGSGGTYQAISRLDGVDIASGINLATTSNNTSAPCEIRSQTIDLADTIKSGATTLEVGILKTGNTDPSDNNVRIGGMSVIVTYTAAVAPTPPTLNVGVSPTDVVNSGSDITIPFIVDLTAPDALDSISADITWDPTKMTFKSGTIGNMPAGNLLAFQNTENSSSGLVRFSVASSVGSPTDFTLYTLVLTANVTNTSVVANVNANVTASSNNNVNLPMTARNLAITVNPVADTTPPPAPTITSTPTNPSNSLSFSFDFSDTEAGVTFNCKLDNDSFTTCTSPFAGTTIDGSRTFHVKAIDAALNESAEATFTWTINTTPPPIPDTTAPVITLNGSASVNLTVGDPYTDLGATASDNIDGNITANIVTVNPVNTALANTYTVTYNVSDNAGNPAAPVTRTVIVSAPIPVLDTTAPVITIPANMILEATSSAGAIANFIVTALDAIEGPVVATCDETSGDTFPLGITTVSCSASDSVPNTANGSFSITVEDTTDPVITLNGSNPQTVLIGNSYVEAGATVTDNYDNSVSLVINSSAVNTDAVGTYSVTYNATDSEGNAAVQKTRTVKVVDQEAPIITLVGANPQIIEVGSSYAELGATVADNSDTGLSATINSSSVNTSVLGNYSVTYDAVDSSDNAATQVTRTVNVVDTTIPVITLIGGANIGLVAGASYTDAGATAEDNYDGDITGDISTGGTFVNTATVGTFTITYNVEDSSDNSALQVTRTINISAAPVPGCTDPAFDNFDPAATEDDGSCENDPAPEVCEDPTANNQGGPLPCTFDTAPILGCTDENATNFNENATEDDGSCIESNEGHTSRGDSSRTRSSSSNPSTPSTTPTTSTPSIGQVLGEKTFEFTLYMKVGSRGNEVMELQKKLNALGFGTLVVDGKFGPKTKAAVIKFQTANPPLKADGIVGPMTRAVLNK